MCSIWVGFMVKLKVCFCTCCIVFRKVCTSYSSIERGICRAIYYFGDILKSYTGELSILGAILGSS